MRKMLLSFLGLAMVFGFVGAAGAEVNSVTPSTNDINRTNGWAHVNVVDDSVPGEITLEFVSTRNFFSCFEYRADDEPNTVAGPNPNTDITDGRWTQVCVSNSTTTRTIEADEFVDVRMVYGAERDERFDWMRFDVAQELYDRKAKILSPKEVEELFGTVIFKAYLNDDDADSVQWAIRPGTCAMGAPAVFGNVDGRTEVADIDQSDLAMQTFAFVGDMTEMEPGPYCFVYNPVEDAGESDIRLTREFMLVEPPANMPTDKDQCKNGGYKEYGFKNQGLCIQHVMKPMSV